MRALQWLENKEIIKLEKTTKEIINLDKNGINYIKNGLPEVRFLKALTKPLTLQELQKVSNLEKDEINVSLGLLKKRGLISIGEKIQKLKDSDKILELSEEFLKSLPLETKTYELETCIEGIERIEIYAVVYTPSGIQVIGPRLDSWIVEG